MELGFGTVDLEPGFVPARPRWFTLLGAIAIPMALAAALIPLRGDLAHSAGIILVLPILAFGLRSGTLAGVLSALGAAIGFDLFLLPPYYTPRIDRAEDVIAGITLLVVGLVVGLLGSRLTQMDRRSAERLRELSILGAHTQVLADLSSVSGTIDMAAAIRATDANLTSLLKLSSCRWEAMTDWDPRATLGQPTMLDNGQIVGRLADLPEDRALLPNPVELVVAGERRPYGRFVLEPSGSRTSIEERRIAATLCRLTATYLSTQES